MNAHAILEKLENLSVSAELVGLDIVFKPIHKIPLQLIPDIRASKSDIISLLHGKKFNFRYPEGTPLEIEQKEIMRQVEEIGIVLLWSRVLNDFIAITKSNGDKVNFPPGFVNYSKAEIEILFADDLPEDSIRLVHEAKKQDMKIVCNDRHIEIGEHTNEDQNG